MECEHVFGLSKNEERYIPAEVEVGEQIDEEICCPICDYNLKSLHFGAICPECGARIPSSKAAIHDAKRGPDRDIPTWLSVGLWTIAVGGLVATRVTRSPYGLILAMMSSGWYLILIGRQGLRRRRVYAPSRFIRNEVRGGFAVFWSSIYLGAGGLLLATGVVWPAVIVLQRLGIL